jgi:predicted CoA-binding protein
MNAHIPPVAKARAFASLLLNCTPAASIAAELTNKTLQAQRLPVRFARPGYEVLPVVPEHSGGGSYQMSAVASA